MTKVKYVTMEDKAKHKKVLTIGKEALQEYYGLKLQEYYYHNFTPEMLAEPTERCVITDQVEHAYMIGVLDMFGLAMVKELVHWEDGRFTANHDHHMCMVKVLGLAKSLRLPLGALIRKQELCEPNYGIRKLTTITLDGQDERSKATKLISFECLR